MKKQISKTSTDKLYVKLQQHYQDSALVNGYRLHTYFLREQELILKLLGRKPGSILDIACGSGLMLIPLVENGQTVVGLDFNKTACQSAKNNLNHIIRGDAFALPIENNSFNAAISCQFLNQQLPEDVPKFIQECYRILKPQGKLVIIWRNGSALIHQLAHAVYTIADRLMKRPNFPVFNHSIEQLNSYAKQSGFKIVEQRVSFPLFRWQSKKLDSLVAKMIGASHVLVLEKC